MLLLNNSNSDNEKLKLNLLISKIYKVKGDYSSAYKFLFEAEKLIENSTPEEIVKLNLAKAEILRYLYLDNPSNKCVELAFENSNKIIDKKVSAKMQSLIIFEKLSMLLERQKNNEFNQLLIENETSIFQNQNDNREYLKKYYLLKAKYSNEIGGYKNAQLFLLKTNELLLKDEKIDLFSEAKYLNELAKYYFHNRTYNKAIEALDKAMSNSKKIENIYLIEMIHKSYVLNYLALKNEKKYKENTTDFIKIKSELSENEEETVNVIYNFINQENEIKYNLLQSKYNTKLVVFIGLFLITIMLSLFILQKYYSRKKRLSEIINYLEITRNNQIIKHVEKDISTKKISIPLETEQAIINKLKRFENGSKFTNKEMSLAVLAGQFDTNTKYLSEIINKHYHVNFNTYINQLRINYIVEKLKTDPNYINYKISYLAEASGFSSHSSFATIFKTITGIAPITFIELLKKEKEESKLSETKDE